MVRVTISGIECQLDSSQTITLKFDSESLADLESGRTGSTISFKLPLSSQNRAIFGVECDIHPISKFNSEWHEMIIEADGINIFEGTAYLMQIVYEEGERYAVVECRGGVVAWATDAAATQFSKIAISYSDSLNETTIKESWESDSPVKFFPIVRDSYEPKGSSVNVTGVRVARTIDDYHPFFRLSSLFEAIFESSGYTIESQTAAREHFESLYISGNYSSEDSSAAQEAMGFYLKRGEDTTTETDSLGRVSLSPYDLASTVGNIVDLDTVSSDSECYNHGNVMQISGEALTFVPLTEISAGFEYFLHYTCESEIESRSKLKTIDTLNTISDGAIEWEVTNRYIDQRGSLIAGLSYKLMIFDFDLGEEFRLVGISASGQETTIATSDSRMSGFTLSSTYVSYRLDRFENTLYIEYEDDWAIYYGYIEESALIEVEVTLRSAPQSYSPTSPMEFEYQLLQGATPGAEFTLHADSSLRPYFSYHPGYNSTVTFEDLAQHPYTALELLSSVQHLFNLRFLTDESSKRVVIESFDEFYSGELRDWSERVIEGETIEFSDWAHSTHRSLKYGYQQTDGVVQRMGEIDNAYFGEWNCTIDSYAAASTSLTLLNPFLCASTGDDDGVMVVGDRDDFESVDSLNFSPRIARYFEMREVEDENYSIPYIAFHDADKEFTLCFEDRDSIEGLNRHYLRQMTLLERGQLIEISVRLTAYDYSNLLSADATGGASCRDMFYFELDGESFRTILHSIESYDPQKGVARCLFLTID
ncbi:MAG: hypothetical protein SNI51_00190 [Rikenellaceae bacterium]